MSASIRSVVPRNYGEVKREAPEPERERRPHDCEHCGRHFEFADEQCACTARSNRISWAR